MGDSRRMASHHTASGIAHRCRLSLQPPSLAAHGGACLFSDLSRMAARRSQENTAVPFRSRKRSEQLMIGRTCLWLLLVVAAFSCRNSEVKLDGVDLNAWIRDPGGCLGHRTA